MEENLSKVKTTTREKISSPPSHVLNGAWGSIEVLNSPTTFGGGRENLILGRNHK